MRRLPNSVLALIFSIGLINSASATLMTQTVDLTASDFLSPISFNGFDGTLGALNSVRLDYTASVDAYVFDPFTLCEAIGDCDGSFDLTLSGAGAFAGLSNSTSQAVTNGEVDAGVTKSLVLSGSALLAPADFLLPGPIGSGQLAIGASGDLGGSIFFLDSVYSAQAASFSLIYDYSSPANVEAVPEPTTFALLGLGLAAIGFSRRRSR